MKIEILERDDPFVRYILYEDPSSPQDDVGREICQIHRDCSREIALAKKKHVALWSIIKQAESGNYH